MKFVIATAACLIVLSLGGCTSEARPATSPTASVSGTPSVAVLSPAGTDLLEQALTSSEPDQVRAVLAEQVADSWYTNPGELLPAGSTLEIDPSTATARGVFLDVYATSRTSGQAEQRWILTLVREGQDWKLLGTRAAS